VQHHTATPHCKTAVQHYTATTHCNTTLQHHTATTFLGEALTHNVASAKALPQKHPRCQGKGGLSNIHVDLPSIQKFGFKGLILGFRE